MKNKFLVYPAKMLAGLGTFAACTVLGSTCIYTGRYTAAAVFWLIAVVFLVVGLNYSCMICVEQEGLRKTLLGKTLRFLPWDQIREIGVTGTRVFGATEKKTGTLFIYISTRELSEEEHFRMILEWPPKEQLYLEYQKERIELIQLHWSGRVKTYQTGTLIFS